jgi:hypothetical protein
VRHRVQPGWMCPYPIGLCVSTTHKGSLTALASSALGDRARAGEANLPPDAKALSTLPKLLDALLVSGCRGGPNMMQI